VDCPASRGILLMCPSSTAPRPTSPCAANGCDPLIPTINARILNRAIPNARLHLYRGGHLTLVTEPADLAPVIDAFLAQP